MLHHLLSDFGSLWVNLNNDEVHYCKIVLDEIFGRNNFLCDISWEKRCPPILDAREFGHVLDHILVYRKTRLFERNQLPLTEEQFRKYRNPDNDPRGPWKAVDYTCNFTALQCPERFYAVTHPKTGEKIYPEKNRVWAALPAEHRKNMQENRLWWGEDGMDHFPVQKSFLYAVHQEMIPMSLWRYEFAGTNQDAKEENIRLFGSNMFTTPKPEKLIRAILNIATKPNDLVLDAFLGSGTTAAAAHKMGRRWIGIEMGNQAYTHCKVRLDKVIDGTDPGGITGTEKWQGGGSYTFCELARPILNHDTFGKPVIDKAYHAVKLATAVALHEGFFFRPNKDCFWKQAVKNRNSYLLVTTSHVTAGYLHPIHAALKKGESLTVVCKSFDPEAERLHKRIVIARIPPELLAQCAASDSHQDTDIVHPPAYRPD